MLQISLVPDEHDDDVGICVVSQLLQPPAGIFKSGWLCHIVNKKSSERTSIIGTGDCSVVPYLSLNSSALNLESAGGEFDADGRFGFEAELVARESGEEVGFADP
ncbi:unnamed protein product [Camellia sinensis]